MYNDEEGRKWILKKLGQFNSTAKVKKLSFFMYSFYSHLSTKSQESPEFSFVGKYQYFVKFICSEKASKFEKILLAHFELTRYS